MSILKKDVNNRDVVKLFDDGIVIDQKLPKWVNASKRLAEKKKPIEKRSEGTFYQIRQTVSDPGTTNVYVDMNTPFTVYHTSEPYEVGENVNFDEIAASNLMELTELIKSGELNNILSGYGGMHGGMSNQVVFQSGDTGGGRMSGFEKFSKKVAYALKKVFTKRPEFDAIEFFTQVKLTSKESAITYRDRVSKYLQAVHNAHLVGQTALVEKLLSELIANKYESLLFANGKYYVVTEEQLVNFAKKTERGIDLCYLKNFTRPLPQDVINKVAEVSNLEVFDNYVVLHYDPKGEHKKETRKEEAKRKDPIIFGVIAGSRKLYYITDWIDESCNLTLEKFVDTLGIDKESLADGPEEKKEETVEEKPKKRGRKKKDV